MAGGLQRLLRPRGNMIRNRDLQPLTVLDEVFRANMNPREIFHDRLEAMQADLDAWLVRHTAEPASGPSFSG